VHDRGALLIRGGQANRRGDALVVIARRVVEDLPDRLGGLALLKDQHGRPACVRPGADLVVLVVVLLEGVTQAAAFQCRGL
jgi:hypothetical protein